MRLRPFAVSWKKPGSGLKVMAFALRRVATYNVLPVRGRRGGLQPLLPVGLRRLASARLLIWCAIRGGVPVLAGGQFWR